MPVLNLMEKGRVRVEVESIEDDIHFVVDGRDVEVSFTMPRESAEQLLYALLAALEKDDE